MKKLLLLAFFITLGINADAQHSRVVAEVAASSDRIVTGAPFSAEAISESIQTLADGNRIIRSSTSKMFRNSEGRFRREMETSSGDVFGTVFFTGEGVTIVDPIAGRRILVDDERKTIRFSTLVKAPEATWTTTTQKDGQLEKTTTVVRTKESIKAAEALVSAANANTVAFSYSFPGAGADVFKRDAKTEDLGTREIEGVMAEGKRTITTIPAGAIGNERPIEIVYERWFSNELQLTLFSRHNDPRFGEQTYRMINISRTEPDASLFSAPSGYKVITGPENVFRLARPMPPNPPSPAEGPRVVHIAKPRTPEIKDSLPSQNDDNSRPTKP